MGRLDQQTGVIAGHQGHESGAGLALAFKIGHRRFIAMMPIGHNHRLVSQNLLKPVGGGSVAHAVQPGNMAVIGHGDPQWLTVARRQNQSLRLLAGVIKNAEELAELGAGGLEQLQAVRLGTGMRQLMAHHAARLIGATGDLGHQCPAMVGLAAMLKLLLPDVKRLLAVLREHAGVEPLIELPGRGLIFAVTVTLRQHQADDIMIAPVMVDLTLSGIYHIVRWRNQSANIVA